MSNPGQLFLKARQLVVAMANKQGGGGGGGGAFFRDYAPQALKRAIEREPIAMSASFREKVKSLANEKVTPLSLHLLYTLGKDPDPASRLRNAQFLHRELPIRLAQRSCELMHLPHGLSQVSGIEQVAKCYGQYAIDLLNTGRPNDAKEAHEFTCVLANLIMDAQSIPWALSYGVRDFRREHPKLESDKRIRKDVEDMLTRFFTGRIGLRFLIEHQIATTEPKAGCSGIIQSKVAPMQVAREAAAHAQSVCIQNFGVAPAVTVVGDESIRFTYVPSHLSYMLFELVKNSCRAVVETHGKDIAKKKKAAEEATKAAAAAQAEAERAAAEGGAGGGAEAPPTPPPAAAAVGGTAATGGGVAAEAAAAGAAAAAGTAAAAAGGGGGAGRRSRRRSRMTSSSSSIAQHTLIEDGLALDECISPFLPPIKIVVCRGDEDITFKVADEGGGLTRSELNKCWGYFYSTASGQEHGDGDSEEHPPLVGWQAAQQGAGIAAAQATATAQGAATGQPGQTGQTLQALAGTGLGLPLSRIYAMYFGGNLHLKTMENFGVDSYLHLNRLGTNCENLPAVVRASPGGWDSTPTKERGNQ